MQHGRGRRQRPQACPVDLDEPVVGDLFAGEQGPHDLHALGQAGGAHRLVRPAITGDVLVRRFAGAEGDPQPAGVHLQQGRHGLGDDRRVVALAGRVDDAERQASSPSVRRPATTRRTRSGPDGCSTERSDPRTCRRRSRRPRRRGRQRAARSGRSARAMRANRRSSPAWGSPLGRRANPLCGIRAGIVPDSGTIPARIRIPPSWWSCGEGVRITTRRVLDALQRRLHVRPCSSNRRRRMRSSLSGMASMATLIPLRAGPCASTGRPWCAAPSGSSVNRHVDDGSSGSPTDHSNVAPGSNAEIVDTVSH